MSDIEKDVTPPKTEPVVEPTNWEKDVLHRFLASSITEQRRARRWGIFFKFLVFAYLFALLFALKPNWYKFDKDEGGEGTGNKHTAIIEIKGAIAADGEASADNIITGLRAAFKDKDTAGIILRINSPGGSPVQAGYINDEIARLRKKHDKIPVYAVITDLCASGGYYIAAGADKIYADKASLVGSIGVIMSSFGFVDAMGKLGIERRTLTSGEHKALLDPFSPVKEEETKHLKAMLDNVHQQFIDVVKKGRGDRLKDNPDLFSGLIWTGEKAIELGLVDALGSSSSVARDVIKAEKLVNFTPKANYLDRFAERLGVSVANLLFQASASNVMK
ncbi:MAG: signal peptide peptidase SppA [Thiotrichaceae bacterium]|nr:signal peptide peptidase SppA [Thiotrichaceae bacterium]